MWSYTHSISIYRLCVCVCNHSDVAHSALDRSNGISVQMKPLGHTIPALSELRGTIHLKTNIPHVSVNQRTWTGWDAAGGWRAAPAKPRGFWSLLASLIFLSKWLHSNLIWNRRKNEWCKFTNLLPVCGCMNAWVSTCWNACVCLELIHKLKITHTEASLCRRCYSGLTQTRHVCVSEWVSEFCSM